MATKLHKVYNSWRYPSPQDLRNNPNHFWIGSFSSKELDHTHIHDFVQLWYVLRGDCHHHFNGTGFIQKDGDLLVVPPFFKHFVDTSQSDNILFICCEFSEGFINSFYNNDKPDSLFHSVYIKPLMANASTNPFLTLQYETKQKLEVIFHALIDEYRNITEFSFTYIRLNLIKLLTLILNEYKQPSSNHSLPVKYRTSIQHVLDYVDNNFTKNITLKDICKVSMMSESSFIYVFKQITGKTFVEYLNYSRVNMARKLLSNSNHSVTDICLECGFRDTSHFNHIFKKLTNFSPIIYRDIYQDPAKL